MLGYLNINPINFLILSGVLQGILLGLLLLFMKPQAKSNRWLALAIICVNFHILYLMIIDLDLERRHSFLLWFPYSYLTALGPLIYLYVKSLIAERFEMGSTEYKLFIPVGFEVGLQLVCIGYGIQQDIVFYNTPFNATLSVVIFLAAAVSIFYYLKRSRNLLQSHQEWAKANFSTLDTVTPGWLYELLKYYRIIWLLCVPFVIVFLFIFRLQWQYLILAMIAYVLLLCITYLTYWIGIKGFSQMGLIKPFKNEPDSRSVSTYAKLTDSQVKQYLIQINEQVKKEKLFLEQDLDLRGLAKNVGFKPNLLSYLLNRHLGKSFYEYVNSFRIEEVKQRLESDEFRHLSILAIAFDCGFNSKTSFNRIFKQMTGLTPSQYQGGK
ncbi:MAG: helix-turn-helix domain-containing protein [Bacteroidota bacterium]